MVAIALAALALSVPPAGFSASPRLEPAASFVAGKAVQVQCAATADDWRASAAANGGDRIGTASIGGTTMHFAPEVCRACAIVSAAAPGSLYSLAVLLMVLVHESIHLRGERDERVTDCARPTSSRASP